MRLLGCAMTSPAKVADFLTKKNLNFGIFPVNFSLSESEHRKFAMAHDYLLILTYADFKNNLDNLNNKKLAGKTFVLFAPVVRFRNIANVEMVDVDSLEAKLNQPYRFKAPDFNLFKLVKPTLHTIEITDEKYLPLLINNALSGSILTHLMTLIYKIPNGKVQNEYRDKIIGWFVLGDDKFATIKGLIDTITQTEVREGLIKLIKASKNYKDVFKHIAELNATKKPVSYSKISEKMNVNEFDLRYMISVAAKISFGEGLKEKNIADHYYSHDRNSHKRKPQEVEKNGKDNKVKRRS